MRIAVQILCLPLTAFWIRAADTKSVSAAPRAKAMKLERAGLTNFYRVTANLFRGSQPTAEGMRQLEALGIRTILNLRAFHSDKDELAESKTTLRRESIRFNTWHPEDEDVTRFLRIVTDTNHQPVFVHCARGADRTGTMIAIYRMAVEGWSKDEAIQEMTQGGFAFDPDREKLVPFLRKLDVEALRRRAGIAPPKDGAK